jgi:ABC-2 type transport system permease protein
MKPFATLNLVLLLTIVVLVNLVSGNAFFRLDLTASGAYRLSQVTRETLSRAEDPLRVRVFYSDQVPPPYNGVRRYLLDLLREFETLGGERVSYEVVDLSTPEGRSAAQEYGLQQVEIQEVRSDEFQSRAVYLGAVILYGSAVETVDRITATDGLEYRLATAMRRAITQVDALAGTTEPVVMRAFISPGLGEVQIEGLPDLPGELREIFRRVNRDHYDRLQFDLQEPGPGEARRLAAEYNLEPLRWRDSAGREREGLLEVVLSYGERTQRVPLEIFSGLFGGYSLSRPDEIEEAIRRGLRTLVAANPRVAYATGAGERAIGDHQRGAGPFADLLRERYEIVPVDLDGEAIPADIDTLILNGPRRPYSERALYRIDQFVMNGGSLLVFLDRYVEEMPSQQEMMFGAQPEWHQVETGLGRLLDRYGVEVGDGFVLDEAGFVATMQGRRMTIYQAPVLQGASLNRESVITRALEDVIVLNATEIERSRHDAARDEGRAAAHDAAGSVRFTPLLQTSPASWTIDHPADAGPWIEGAPAGETTDRRIVAALLEGAFESYFTSPVALEDPDAPTTPDAPNAPPADPEAGTSAGALADPEAGTITVEADRFRTRSARESRIVVLSTSEVTTAQLLDPRNRTPNGTFLMNTVDYLKGAPAFAELRSKGLGVPRLEISSPAVPGMVRWTNVIGVPLLVVVIGLAVHRRRRLRARRIQAIFHDGSGSV